MKRGWTGRPLSQEMEQLASSAGCEQGLGRASPALPLALRFDEADVTAF